MSSTNGEPVDSRELSHTAVNCYLSAILCVADCIATMCPPIGVPYQHRWRRLPQRLGFDLSPSNLEATEQMFESEIHKFAELAGPYFKQGLPLIRTIGSVGALTAEAVVEVAASVSQLLNSLAESTDNAADLEAPPEMREMLESHAEALRRSSRQIQNQLLPPLQHLGTVIRDCVKLATQTENAAVLDVYTNFVNMRGFRLELDRRIEEKKKCVVTLFSCIADSTSQQDWSQDDFGKIAAEVATQLSTQFRPADCLGRVGALRFGIISDNEIKRMQTRCEQIARGLSGAYPFRSGSVSLSAEVRSAEVVDTDSLANVLTDLEDATPAELSSCVS
jgi:GGDEF domain-containing protein